MVSLLESSCCGRLSAGCVGAGRFDSAEVAIGGPVSGGGRRSDSMRSFICGFTAPLPAGASEYPPGLPRADLAKSLSFPFRASYWKEAEPLVLDITVIATGLFPPGSGPIPLDSGGGHSLRSRLSQRRDAAAGII